MLNTYPLAELLLIYECRAFVHVCSAGDPVARAIVLQAAEAVKSVGPFVELETPAQSASLQLRIIDQLKPTDNGHFLAHTGGEWGQTK